VKAFRERVYRYYEENGRHDLPWRLTTDSYAIFVSEVMLQQTQAARVIPKYKAFTARYPSVADLARSSTRELLALWSGLGYNRRALWLKEAAQMLVRAYNGSVPCNPEMLTRLKGIGYATACAIVTYSCNLPTAFIETNIRTVFIHHFFQGREHVHDREILPVVEDALDRSNPRVWYYALMDYGVYLKKEYPDASRRSSHYTKQSPFRGSDRQIRGWLVKHLSKGDLFVKECTAVCRESLGACVTERRIHKILSAMEQERFVIVQNGIVKIFQED